MKLSIIIPAFNASSYIGDCLKSIFAQNLDDSIYELLIIDDGSNDDTLKIAKSLCANRVNVHFFLNKSNLGNGAARNIGIDNARGEYIYFIDADDYIAENTLYNLLELAQSHKLELLFFSIKHVKNSSLKLSSTKFNSTIEVKIFDGISFIAKAPYRDEVWSYLIKRKFLSDTGVRYYDDKKFAQDLYITSTLLSLAKRVSRIEFDMYRYRSTPNSIVTKKTNEHLVTHMESVYTAINKVQILRQDLIKKGITNKNALLRLHVKQQRWVVIIIMRFIQSDMPYSYLDTMLQELKNKGIYPMKTLFKLADFDSPKQRRITFVFNRNFLLRPFTSVYRLYQKNH